MSRRSRRLPQPRQPWPQSKDSEEVVGVDDECENRSGCDWPKDRSRILAELDRLKGGESQGTAIVKQLIELTVEVRNLNEKIGRLSAEGTAYAHKEVEAIHSVLQQHALELREQRIKQNALSGLFGILGGAIASLIAWILHKA
jgi:hypothetical protein